MVIGALMAYTVIGASGAQFIFWAGVVLAAIGAAVFFRR
jgi:LPXTG-motif cell wall-anchored protein